MNIFFKIVIISCIHALFKNNLNEVEYFIYNIPKNCYWNALTSKMPYSYWKIKSFNIFFTILWPFYCNIFPDWHKHSWHEGFFISYATVMSRKDSIKLSLNENKLYWKKLFIEHNIPSPKLFAYVLNKKWTLVQTPDNAESNVIVKVNNGCCGNGIIIRNWNDVLENKPIYDCVIEEYKKVNPPVHYRVTTLLKNSNTVIPLQILKIKDSNAKIVSNKGRVVNYKENIKSVEKLVNLHENLFKNIFSISWDVIIDKNNEFVLEGNVPGALCWKTECADINRKYFCYAKNWLKINSEL